MRAEFVRGVQSLLIVVRGGAQCEAEGVVYEAAVTSIPNKQRSSGSSSSNNIDEDIDSSGNTDDSGHSTRTSSTAFTAAVFFSVSKMTLRRDVALLRVTP